MHRIALLILFFSQYILFAQSFNYLPTSTTKQLVYHQYYTLSYSEKHEQAEWVAYELTATEAQGTTARHDDFRPDPKVKTGSSDLNDYKGSGYDRGHLAPAADMKFNATAMSECFYMSNMSPQDPSLNRGAWKNLEEQVRRWAIENDRIYIVTGGVLNYSNGVIGPNKVTVPKYYYKIILDYTQPSIKAIALILPNKKCVNSLQSYIVTIDSVEKITGIDFFPKLPDALEKQLESKKTPEKWFKNYSISPTH